MTKVLRAFGFPIIAVVAMMLIGCEPPPPQVPRNLLPGPTSAPVAVASTQPVDVVAQLSTLQVSRADLDQLLYETYGLRMLFDIVELDLAKTTLKAQGLTITPADIQAERKIIMAGIRGDAPESDTENLFNQLLQREHITRPEFDVKIVQTDAYLRKIVTPMVAGKLSESVLHRGFEMMYGEKRQIADIELNNVREAETAAAKIKTQPFAQVASAMSIDQQAAANGGLWVPFSSQEKWVPQVIIDSAFSLEKGHCSDILEADGKYHIIKLVDIIEPKIVKYEDVKDDVRQKLEDRLITIDMKELRQELTFKAQHEMHFVDPVLKAQWDALVAQQTAGTDREAALKKLNDNTIHSPKMPAATQP